MELLACIAKIPEDKTEHPMVSPQQHIDCRLLLLGSDSVAATRELPSFYKDIRSSLREQT